MRIAVIGAGVSGNVAARLLSSRHEVTLFEANDFAGGHANTVDVSVGNQQFSVDTGFMVFNERTYPNFSRTLGLLEVDSQPSEMSFSVHCDRTDLEYQGSSVNGLFAQRLNAVRPSFLRMLLDIARFNRHGTQAAASGVLKDGRSVGDFVRDCKVGSRFVEQYLVPMSSAIWSSQPDAILDFPAEFMIGFFANHGLMQLRDRPQWRTIVGGSRTYVRALLEPIQTQVHLNTPIASVARTDTDVVVTPVEGRQQRFDQVVLATHADQSLQMLADPTQAERQILGAFPYQANEAVLHTDTRLLPHRKRAWASWNYHIAAGVQHSAAVTYDLSCLQNHASSTPILLTLNATDDIEPGKILRNFTYHHPAYSRESITAQRRFHEVSGRNRTHFCGAYWGYGFHEDGVNSALAVAKQFDVGLESCKAVSTKDS